MSRRHAESKGRGMIKTWQERCQKHPDHQMGMVSNAMIQARMQEEIDELRAALAKPEQEPVCDKDPQGCWSIRCQLGKVCKNIATRCEYIRSSGSTHWCALAEAGSKEKNS